MKTCKKCLISKDESLFRIQHWTCKKCECAEQKVRAAANPERIKETYKKWASKNRTHLNEWKRNDAKKFPEKHKRYSDKSYYKNRDKRLAYNKLNQKKRTAQTTEWYKNNPVAAKKIKTKTEKGQRERLIPSYVKGLIRNNIKKLTGIVIKNSEIPDGLVELHTEVVKSKRLLNNK